MTAADLEWRFEGRVTFRAHDGLLDVRIGDPWVRLVDDGLELSVTDERGDAGHRGDRARARAPSGHRCPSTSLPGAEHLFASTYPAGTPLAPLVLHPRTPPPDRAATPT